MATQAPEREVVVLRKKPPKPAPKPKPKFYEDPYTEGSFYLQAENRRKGNWTHLNDVLLNLNISEDVGDCSVKCSVSLSNLTTENGKRVGDVVTKGTNVRLYYAANDTAPLREMHRFRVWDRRSGSDEQLNLTLYDHLMILKHSDCAVVYSTGRSKKSAWTVSRIHKDFCKKYGIPMGHVPKSKTKVPYIFHEGSMYDFLLKLWTLDRQATNRKWLLRMEKGKLVVRRKKPAGLQWELTAYESSGKDIGSLIRAEYTTGIHEETATAVTVRGVGKDGDGRSAAVVVYAENTKLKNQFGLLHKTITVQGLSSKAKARQLAKLQLRSRARPRNEATVEALGIPHLRAGDAIWTTDKESGLRGQFYTASIEKNITADGTFTMNVRLNWLDIVPTLQAEADELRPSNTGGKGGKYDGKTGGGSPTSLPSWLQPIMLEATKEAKVPESWASSPALARIIHAESRFDPNAQNPTSTAYGLFQFLDATWKETRVAKTSDPYMQCVAGLRYIKGRKNLRTPEGAWAYRQRTGIY